MSHMVVFRDPAGAPGYHQTDALDEAVAEVERLRNEDDVEHARIFELHEVNFAFRPYFRVEIDGSDAATADSEKASPPAVVASDGPRLGPVLPDPPATFDRDALEGRRASAETPESVPEPAATTRRGLFGR